MCDMLRVWRGSLCFAFLLSLLCWPLPAATMEYPDFINSMLRLQIYPQTTLELTEFRRLYHSYDPTFLKLFEEDYNENVRLAKSTPEDAPYRIPRIIHQIWLGPRPIPEAYFDWMQAWANLEGWEYHLWTDAEVQGMPMYNRDLYDLATNYGEKSDILRLELLLQYGGVYVDADYECLDQKRFEEFHRSFDLYIGFEALLHGCIQRFRLFQLCNAIMAARPHHPLIDDLVTNLRANYLAYRPICGTFHRTGPSYITRIVCEYEHSHAHKQRNMYFPCTVLYPLTEPETQNMTLEEIHEATAYFPEATGIHYWGGSWWRDKHNPTSPYPTPQSSS